MTELSVLIVPNTDKPLAVSCAERAQEVLERFGCKTRLVLKENDFIELIPDTDLIITLGGDGTTIRSAKAAALHNKPVLGINAGRLGFLAGLESNELEKLTALISGEYSVEKRMLLDVSVQRPGGCESTHYLAMNDAVLARGSLSQIVDLSIQCVDSQSLKYRADGIIAATPTGSSAYTLSAGGPLIDPLLSCIIVTPICAHSFFARPLIFSDSEQITLSGRVSQGNEIYLTIDGEESIAISENDRVSIRKSEHYATLIRIKNESFFDIIKKKFLD